MRRCPCLIGLVAGSLVAAASASAHCAETTARGFPADLFEKAKAATVEVLVDDHLQGTGWFVDPQGWAFTAAHMIASPANRVEVLAAAAGRRGAKVVAVDLGHDLALLKVEPRDGGYPAMPLAKSVPPPGESIYLLGTPIFRHSVLLRGMVASDRPVFEYYSSRYVEILHVSATLQGGTSGAAWFNRRGEVVGQQSAVMSLNSVPVGITDMIPVEAIHALWKTKKTASTPSMGMAVEETWQQDRKLLERFPPQTEGLVVRVLEKDRPAERTGLKQWDVVVAADGQKTRLVDQLIGLVRRKQPGQAVKLTVLGPDGTGTREVTVTLGRLEVGWP